MYNISIHAAREGGDVIDELQLSDVEFQSTPPVKAATINIRPRRGICVFQSTPPVKAATIFLGKQYLGQKFQSTPPVKAATSAAQYLDTRTLLISIHAAREGGDPC